ncbi:putative ABC transport system permease protein [Litoreibacter ponti]|uniref:Putative ABC transport system permease protein n=1 Tax=Litoreibacter ponti TaxID=1510457 RepID=A0A2T6BJA7_9RHOB|nr:FtsX-like permease family protein [Litoreibacter ponti]PTX56148.1 putative ABC transport system permease protein [Litoreibacter ponti]
MTAAGLQALWSHWLRNKLQLFTLIAGLALATALWTGVQAVNVEARASYDAAAATLDEGRYDQLVPRAGSTIPLATYVALRRAGWQVSPVVEGELDGIRVIGLDPLTSPGGMGPVSLGPEQELGDVLGGATVFADAQTASRIAREGLRVTENPDIAPGTALADISTAQELLGQPGISRLIIAPIQPLGRPPLDTLAPDLTLRAAQGGSDIGRLTDSFHLNLTAFGLLSFAVGIFIVHGAIGLAFEQRRAMVRTLRAVGMPLSRLIALLALEITALALVAGALGVVLGYLVAATLLPDVAATLRGLYGAEVSNQLQLRPEWWLSGLAIALVGAALAASGALWQIARMPLLASGGARAWAMASGKARAWQIVGAVALLSGAALLALFGEGLIAGFALLGCLLIGAALALPMVLDRVLTLAARTTRAVKWQWFWADTRQQLRGLSLALMALLLAMAANVGVSTMVSSFRTTFVGFLDQRLAAELYVSTAATDAARLEAFALERAREVMPILSVDTTAAGLPAELYGARIGDTYRENWTFLDASPAPWDRVAAGEALLINEQLARRAGLWVGDPLALSADLTLPIAGVFGDYGNPIGQVIISEPLFATLHPGERPTRFGLRTDDPDALRRALVETFGLPAENIIDQAGIKAFSLGVFERTFTVTAALNVLTLSVAGFAILMSLLTLSAMRVPQLAPVWALGLTRREMGRLELIRALILASLTALLALPLGLALAWVLLAVVNVQAFGWKLPMFLFPLDYARLGLFALLAAALAALWPAWRLARTPPSDLLKVFANER